jgi:hypothetical protein
MTGRDRDNRIVLRRLSALLRAVARDENRQALFAGNTGCRILVLVRLRCAEAQVDLAAGERGQAEQALRATAAGFIERDLGVDAALSFLDLAALYLREGAEQSIFHQLSADLLPVFFYSEVGREAMAFLLWFQQACETGKLTAGIVASVGQAAEGQRQPSLAWWSAPQIPSKEGTGDAGAAALG